MASNSLCPDKPRRTFSFCYAGCALCTFSFSQSSSVKTDNIKISGTVVEMETQMQPFSLSTAILCLLWNLKCITSTTAKASHKTYCPLRRAEGHFLSLISTIAFTTDQTTRGSSPNMYWYATSRLKYCTISHRCTLYTLAGLTSLNTQYNRIIGWSICLQSHFMKMSIIYYSK